MADVEITIDPAWLGHLEKLNDATIERLCQDIATDAARLAPVLTGDLRNTVQVLGVQDGVGRVGAGNDHVDYAGYVELGTRKMAAQAYLKPAAYRARAL